MTNEKGRTMAKKTNKANKTIEILQHNISYCYRDYDGEMNETEQEHVKEMIVEGYGQGELCMLGKDGMTEYRGWWKIERD